ncbi:MAG: hypothetical protein NZ772_01275 [Cyanobacteria bacterium]|nr:hypothetical protein [Cyanobacteriota bacterium]MDW8200045.1 hypothetical protein [Cyanobacteriota bacterium SKYGB_h_bin112]
MFTRQHCQRLVTAAIIAGAIVVQSVSAALANTLQNGEVSGFINSNSQRFRFRNQSMRNAPVQQAIGQQFSFNANRGDQIEIAIDVEEGSNLKPILVLVEARTGRQIAFDATTGAVKAQIPATGAYRLLVLAQGNTRGRYTLLTSGIAEGGSTQMAEADKVMNDILKLRVIGCGIPDVARIRIGAEERCTRDIGPGLYTYNPTSQSITLVDQRRDVVAQRLQLTLLDTCPPPGTATVRITVPASAQAQQATYCANPSRFVAAGDYTYDIATDKLTPVTTAAQPTTPTTPATPQAPATTPDPRRQLLQTDYGLTVLDSCPPARGSLVVVAFPERNNPTQGFVYCANPNRLVPAGDYVYNQASNQLERAVKAEQCTVSLAGICIVK